MAGSSDTIFGWQKGLRYIAIICLIIGVIIACVMNWMHGNQANVMIETPTRTVAIQAELALTPAKQAFGLMFRSDLPQKSGMLFVFPQKKIVTMWMKNTYIPLDMIFFDENGQIIHIHENAIPHDETTISSRLPAIGVLEVNAGFVKENKIDVGQKIIYPSLTEK